jgi:predicted RNase H-like HicB family nuclease
MAKGTTAAHEAETASNIAVPRELRDELAELRADLDAQAEDLQRTLAELEIGIVDGYLVKIWPDLKSGVWVAHCPTVRCVVQEAARDDALTAIAESIAEMLDVLAETGTELPSRDVAPA